MVLSNTEELGLEAGINIALAPDQPAEVSLQVVFMILLCIWTCGLVGLFKAGIWSWSSSKGREEEKRLPPGPPAWPVIGHLHLLGKLPHQSLAELAQRYAPHLMYLRLGSTPLLVASSPQAAKLILHTHDHIFASRPQSAASRHISFNNSGIGFCPTSPYWRRMRGLCAAELFTNTRIHSFQHIRQAEMRALLRSVFAKHAQVLQVRPMLVATSLNMLSRMIMGHRLSDLAAHNSALCDIGNLIDEVMDLVGKFNLGDFFPFLARIDALIGYERRMKLVGRRLSTALQVLLDLRRAATKGEDKSLPPKDLLDVLMAVPDIKDVNVKAVIADMYVAGTDTTSITVEWVLAELLANPTTLSTLQEELDKVVGKSRLVEEEDIPNLPYLHAVVKESLRLHPPGPLLIPHESIEVCEVCDYIIQPKTRVLVNVWAIGRDPIVWETPQKFDPERFLAEGRYNQVSPHGQHFEFLPFGSGRRKCPALYLGLLNVHIMVASLLQSFDWSFAFSKSKYSIDLSEKFGLTITMACPLAVTLVPRIDATLYQNSM